MLIFPCRLNAAHINYYATDHITEVRYAINTLRKDHNDNTRLEKTMCSWKNRGR